VRRKDISQSYKKNLLLLRNMALKLDDFSSDLCCMHKFNYSSGYFG
jgi:hypothetical protein